MVTTEPETLHVTSSGRSGERAIAAGRREYVYANTLRSMNRQPFDTSLQRQRLKGWTPMGKF
jgi:hypothetical protein